MNLISLATIMLTRRARPSEIVEVPGYMLSVFTCNFSTTGLLVGVIRMCKQQNVQVLLPYMGTGPDKLKQHVH